MIGQEITELLTRLSTKEQNEFCTESTGTPSHRSGKNHDLRSLPRRIWRNPFVERL